MCKEIVVLSSRKEKAEIKETKVLVVAHANKHLHCLKKKIKDLMTG